MKANFMKKTCAWLMTTVTVATAIVPNTVNVAFAADVEPDTNTSMQIDDADVSADTNIAPVEDATPAEDNTTVEEPAVEEPTPTTEEQPTVAPTEDASTSTDEGANKDANVPSEETPSEDATVTEAPKTSSVRFSVPKKGGKVVVNTNTEGSQPVDVLTNEKDYSYKLENVEVGTVISTDVQCDNGYDVASYHVLKDTGKGMVELLEANEVDRVDLEKLKDFVASCTTYKHNITVGEDPIVVEVVFEETKKDENAATDETKKDDSDVAKDATTEETTDETKKDLQVTLGDGAEEHHAFLDKEEGIYNEGDSVIVTVGDYANNIEKGSYALAVTPTNDKDKGNLDSIVLDGEDGTFGFTMPAYPVTVVVTFVENDPNNIEKIYDADDIYLSLNEDFDPNSLLENERIAQIVEFRQAELKEAVVESCDVDTSVLGDYEVYVVVTTKGNSKFKIRFRIHVVEDKDAVDAEGKHNITWFIDDDNHANYTINDNGHSNGKYNAGEQVTFTVSPMEGYMITDVSAVTEGEDGEEGSEIKLTRVSDNSDSSDSNISTGDIEIPVADDSDSDVAVQSVGEETENAEDSTDEKDVNSNEESDASSNSNAVVSQEETDDTSIDYSNADLDSVTYTFTMPDNDVRIVIFTESTVAPLYNPKVEGKIKKYKVVYASDIMAHYKSEYSGGKEASTFYRTAYGVDAEGKKVAGSDAECYCVIAGLSAPEGFVDSGQSNFEELKDGMLVSRALFYMNQGYGVTYPWIDNNGKEIGSTTMKALIGTKGTGFYNTSTTNTAYNLYATKHFILSMLYGFARSKGDHDINNWSESDNIFNAITAHYYPNMNTDFWTSAGRLQLTKMAYVLYNIAGNASCDVTYDGDDGVGKGHVGSRNSKKNVLVSAKTIKLTSDTSKNFYYLAGKSNTATITAPDGVHIYVNNVDCGNSVKIDGRTSFYLKSANTGVQTITIKPESNIAFSAYRIINFDKGYQDLAFIGKGEGSDFYAQIEFEGTGSVKLTKSSANATITKDNPCYSLANAKYDVFSDSAMKNKVGTLTTVADGTTNTLSDLAPGTYYAKETKASKGYKLCGDNHTVTVKANKTATFTCAEKPLDDPGLVLLKKTDKYSADNDLSGAEYTIKYYANTTGDTSGTPMKKWTMKTVKVDGFGQLSLASKANIVSGSYFTKGDGKILAYPIGTYTIQETKAPNNYLVDNTVYVAECKQNGNSVKFTFKNTGTGSVISKNDATGEITHNETPKQYGIKIKKVDNDTQKDEPQGNATLKDATFDIIYTGEGTVGFGDDATKHFKKGDVVTTIKTDENGVAQTSANALYAGTYKVVESGSPYGYDIIDKVLNVTFDGKTDKEGTYKDFTVDVKDAFNETVVRGGVQITKQDAELNKSEAMAGTDLEGISFTITNKSKNSVVVDGKEYAVDEVVKTIKTHKNDDGSYSAETEKDIFPVGTYEIHEVESNKYYFTDGKAVTFEIKEADKDSLKSADVENNKIVFNNQVVRADINLVKINEDHDRMSVPFVIENTVSHEKHVIVTDTNGEFNSTKSAKSKDTNANDKLLDGYVDGETVIPQSSIVYNSGLWFGTGEYGTLAKPNDTLGSLPHGKYTITELRCESNRGYKLVKATFDVAKDTREQTIDLGTFTNRELPPQIKTVALDAKTKDHLSYAGTDCTVIDTVSLSDLVVGKEYTLKASFIDYADEGTGLKANGRLIKGETTFTSTDTNMSVEVKLNMDASKLKNMTGVVYESLYKDGKVIASHESIEDADQTIHFPEIGTKAVDTATDDEVGVSGKEVSVKDTVEYKNLIPGKEYTVKGTLYNKADEKAVSNEVSVNFNPSSANGTVDVVFTFTNKEVIDGMSLVAFESLYIGNAIIADHKDINDEGQTINYPKIGTTVVDDNSGTHTGTVDKEITLTDTVKYDNLVVGKEYTIKGKLMDKETGNALLINGKEITQEYTFKPETKSGSVDLKFTLDSTGLRNKTTVVFEDLIYKGITVATHSDIKDEEQTIHFPNIRTNATDGLSGNHAGTLGKTTVVDKVTYENLVVGKEYTVSGTLMDKETGKEFLVDGKPVTATKTFTAEEANGAVDLVYELDASALEGKTLVVFENLLVNGKKVVSHADITDEDQTVHYPKIRTTASDVDTKDEVGTVKDTTTLTDKVSYWNLVPGTAYTLKGTVYEKESQKAVSSEVTKEFTPTKADDTITLDFSFKSDSEGKDFVVFEDLYTNGKKIASHSNIEDKDQTIHYPKIRTTALDKNSVTHTGTIGKDVTIVDTVKYNNLVVGKEYTLSGKLMNKETGKPLTVNGKEITSMVTFTPDKKDGSIDLKFTLDSSALEDVTTVVYENLNYKKVTVTTHSDINDEEQTIHFPKIRTHAVDSTTGNHVGTVGKTKITDTVTYSNLLPGKEYTLKGTLMDKETGKPLLVNDKEVVATKTFVPTEAKGSVDLVYVVDASALEGKTVVVFEDLYINGKKVVSHADITDEDQTVHYPKIRTTASDVDTKDEVGTVKDTTTLTDKVSYWNLVPGTAYTLKGTVYEKESQKAVSSEVTKEFTPTKADDTITLDFSFKSDSEGKDFVVFEDLYTNGKKIASHSNIEDKDQTIHYPKIRTTALDKNSVTHTGTIGKDVTIVDTVKYNNLVVGKEYTLSGKLMNKETGKPLTVNGKEITSMVTFTPDKKDGSIDLKFTLDSSALEDVTTVVYENLNYKKVTVTTHSDINDEEQTIHFPKIRTHAVDSTTGNHVGTVGKTKITDTVTYSNLLPGKEYTLKGTLMDKETGKPLLVNDKEVVATKTFVPTEAKGSVDLVYVVDASALEGKTVVVFEDLYINGKKVTSHADITDEDQSVHFPKIRTSAVDKTTGFDETLAKGEQTIVDTVSYWNLVVGEKYTVKGKLMDKSTGTALLVNGKEVTVEKEFTADKVNGTINLEFTFDASSLEGKTTVVFEDLYNSGVKVTTHSDIKDEAQTIRFPKVNTNALDKDTQLDEGMAKKTVTVKDDVHYFNLKVGETYKVSGVLMDKDTGEKFLVDGKPVTAEKEFVAEKENGTVTLEFTFDGSALENKTLVVFEDLYHNGKHVGTHTDINDEDQTVRYPKIRTSAIDKETQFNESNADNDVTIVDTVSCWNLTEGNTYTIKGKLMDKSTGEPILVNGKEVIAEKTFVASRRDGEVDLEFKFDGTSLNGKSTVVFEDLFRNGKQLATHSDLNDNAQTTHLPKIATKAYDKDSQIDEAIAKKETTIIDEVSYENLTNGVEYTVKGTLMDKATGEPLLVNGEEVHAEKTFIAGTEGTTEEPKDRVSGKVLLEFTFDSSALEGQDLVVFEEMYREGKEVAFHTDITDGNQTVKFPKLRTTAVDGETNLDEGLGGSSEQKVVDTVSYWNLKPGTTYKIKGILMDKETGKPFLAGENEDQKVTVEKEFTPETADGTIDLEFVFDGIYTASRTVVAFEDLYKEDHHVATHTDINDEDQDVKYPDIRTHALDKENGLNESVADESVTIVDTVSYTNLTVGNTYTITGKLMDKETGEPLLVDGQEVTASKEFTPEETEGSVDIEFTFNGSALKGKTTVAFETLTREDKVVGVHADINDGEQTVHFPEVSTTASDKESGTDEGVFGKESTIVDVVKYNNLSEGVEYTVKGTLMDKETGEALLVDGKEVTAEKTFIAGSENEGYVDGAMTYPPNRVSGEVTLEFTFDSSALAGKSVVVFEKVYCQEKEVAVHTDIEDENQTITYPEVLTTASDKKTGTHEQEADKKVTVVDVVKYKSLKVGKEYTVKGVLMDKETGKELLINEKPVEATATFTPEKPDGEVSLEFTFDSSALAGKTVVAFETLYREEIKVGVHADINDEDQSVHIISIGTKAQDVKSKSSTMTVDKEAKLKDTVSFKGLTVGKQYTLKGVVMDKATSKQVFVDGKKVEATTTFIPKESNGTADVVFTLNTTKLQGRSLVVFEELYDKDNVKVAEHKDLKDKDQTVSVPKVPITPENPGGGSGFAKTGENIAFVLTGIICIIASFGLFGVAVRRRRRRA